MKTEEEIKEKLKEVLELGEKSNEYSRRNAYKGFLKGLLFALDVNFKNRAGYEEIVKTISNFIRLSDKEKNILRRVVESD